MAPTAWTAFTFFGIPFAVGVLGGIHGARLSWRAYHRYRFRDVAVGPASPDVEGTHRYSLREHVLRAVALLAVSAFLLVHSGRWLLSIYGYI